MLHPQRKESGLCFLCWLLECLGQRATHKYAHLAAHQHVAGGGVLADANFRITSHKAPLAQGYGLVRGKSAVPV